MSNIEEITETLSDKNDEIPQIVKNKRIYKKCEHGKRKERCRICGGSSFCEHGRQRSRCKECGGASICEHGRVRSQCKECGGASICEHGRVRSRCKECKGGSICEHGRVRSSCKDCGGTFICEHNRRRQICKDCGGSSICEHGRQRSSCKDCGGTSICEHNRRRQICKDCSGGSICEHGRVRSNCKECKGGSICEHGRYRSQCKECGSVSICEHGRVRSKCKDCGGSSYCEHNKLKYDCKLCDGRNLCKSSWCDKYAIKKYDGYCLTCCIQVRPDIKVSRNYKTKEKEVVDSVLEAYPDFTWINDRRIQDGCSLRRPDLILDMGSHIIIIEVDEDKHHGYSCENRRIMELSQDVGYRPIIFIRFNPDKYTNQNGNKIPSCWMINKLTGVIYIPQTRRDEWDRRIHHLMERIRFWMENPSEKTIEIDELFY
jgi:hypothetical protein